MKLRNVNERQQAQYVSALAVEVKHGAEVTVDDEDVAAGLLASPNWHAVDRDAKALLARLQAETDTETGTDTTVATDSKETAQ